MEVGEKIFLTTNSDLEPINTKLDTIINDTTTVKSTSNTIDSTTKDTNSKVSNTQATVNSINSNLGTVQSTTSATQNTVNAINTNTSAIKSVVDTINTNVSEIKNGSIDGDKYYAGESGTLKTLTSVSSRYHTVIEGRKTAEERYGFVMGYFLPKLSGIHNISLKCEGRGSSSVNYYLSLGTYDDFMRAALIYNTRQLADLVADPAGMDYLYSDDELYNGVAAWITGDNAANSRRMTNAYYPIRYLGHEYAEANTTSTFEYHMFCEKGKPVLIFATSNADTTEDFTLYVTPTVTYRETAY